MAEQAAHCEHLARRAAEEDTHGWKLRGRKLKAPQDKAGHKTRKVSTTDPQSGVMSTAKGFVQGYNAQAVANDEQVIVSAQVTDEHNDSGQLHPMIEAIGEEGQRLDHTGQVMINADIPDTTIAALPLKSFALTVAVTSE